MPEFRAYILGKDDHIVLVCLHSKGHLSTLTGHPSRAAPGVNDRLAMVPRARRPHHQQSRRNPVVRASTSLHLLEIMAALRTSGTGCPWDLEQDF